MPNFVYKKAALWMAEVNALKALSQTGFNCDRKFSVVFADGTADARDERPANYDGRFCVPIVREGTEGASCFLKSRLWNQGFTDRVPFVKPSDMMQIEDMSEDAMPAVSDEKHTICPSIRFQQVGPPAIEAMIRGAADGIHTSNELNGDPMNIMIVDLSADAGVSIQACLNLASSFEAPMSLALLPEDMRRSEWLRELAKREVAANWLN
eukprot:4810456-Pyramimonas_sp.AAC.1